MSKAMRVVTTHGTYTSTVKPEDEAAFDAAIGDGEAFVREMSEIISSTDKRDQNLTINADGIGWVGLNTNHVVAVEILAGDE